jgi:hypothetical protein
MTYRVIFDYGDIEMMIMLGTDSTEEEAIREEAESAIVERGFGLAEEIPTLIIEKAPEWEEE